MLADVTQLNQLRGSNSSCPSSAIPTPVLSPVAVSLSVHQDPLLVPEYHDEIVRHLMLREQQSGAVDASYLTNQPEVTERMRSILIDWLVDVSLKFKLHPETYFLTVNIIDRYLSRHHAQRSRLQLIGITACWIASKHEEIWPPEVRDCVYIAANTYTNQEILECERDVATLLSFRFTVPTSYPILCYLMDSSDSTGFARDASMFFLESSAHDYRMLAHRPSRVACASLLLGHVLMELNSAMQLAAGGGAGGAMSGAELARQMWDMRYVQLSDGVTFEELLPVAEQLLQSTSQLCSQGSRLQALRRKYLQARFGAVASLTLPATLLS